MYIALVRRVLEEAVGVYASNVKADVPSVLGQVRQHIDHTSAEHYKDEPAIEYEDPLCRLGYLYRHAAANATLFEHALRNSPEAKEKVRAAHQGTLRVCAVGGGPGTELLGLTKYLVGGDAFPRKIAFTVLDGVPHWGETWQHLAEVVEDEFRKHLETAGVASR